MRVVRSHAPPGTGETAPSWSVPTSAALDLGARFPAAALVPTTVVRARALDALADRRGLARVWLALESLQVTGSFKVRGALVALAEALGKHGPRVRVLAASAGNHGAGVAYAARALGLHATVVMPAGAPRAKRARVLGYGAELVEIATPHYDDAEAHALDLARAAGTDAVFVSPYDDPFVAAGNGGSLGFEIARALGHTPDVVVCPFGGGGLASGLGWAIDALGEPSARGEPRRVWGVQSEASPAMALSLAAGAAVTRLEADGETLAEGLEGGISDAGFARARVAIAGVVVVPERAIALAMAFALRELGVVLEGSAATALVPVLEGLPEELVPAPHAKDVVVVLTGRNVDRERLLRLPHPGD